MKRIKAIGHLLFSFCGRILRNKWLVAVVVIVVFNVWQANEISELKKQVRVHRNLIAPKPIKALVYIREFGSGEFGSDYHRKSCRVNMFSLADRIPIGFSEAKQKYDPCRVCKPPTNESDAMAHQLIRGLEEEEEEFAAKVERALRRLREGPPLPRY